VNDLYHIGNREFQDQFGSRKLADRVNDLIVHDHITDEERTFIESLDMFFISTVDDQGRPTVSYKGGEPGFIRVIDEKTIAFPGYDGNGMFLTAGNILANHEVGLLLIDFENPQRLRLHGTANVDIDDPLLREYLDAIYIFRITIRNIFLNCPRYIHRSQKIEQSEYIPKQGCKTPIPEWKKLDAVQDVLPKNPNKSV
jgi:predicted pyridoxine 5'-phosphate oxidase superfamily flavin-nucleotide-binding protein